MCPPQSDKGRRKRNVRMEKRIKVGVGWRGIFYFFIFLKQRFFLSNHRVQCGPQMFFCTASAQSLWADPSSPWHENFFSFFFFLDRGKHLFNFYLFFFFSAVENTKSGSIWNATVKHDVPATTGKTLQRESVPVQRRQSIPGNVLRLTDRVRLSAENLPCTLSLVALKTEINRLTYTKSCLMSLVSKFSSIFSYMHVQ